MSNELVGRTFADRYQVLGLLGQGGMAHIYKAIDQRLSRTVALKLMSTSVEEPDIRSQFLREAEVAGRLQHANVLRVYEVGECEGRPYLIREYVEGGSLRNALSGQPLTLSSALAIARQVGDALSYIHGQGLVHRDLTPSNILLRTSDGRVLVTDLALLVEQGASSVTRVGTILGTPAYMSPEQVMGHRVDARSDLFVFGVVVFEMLTGHKPFEADGMTALLYRIITEPAPSPLLYNPSLPGDLAPVLLRALAKSPDARYPSVAEFVEALQLAAGLSDHPVATLKNMGSIVIPPSPAGLVPPPRHEATGVMVPLSDPMLPATAALPRESYPAWLLAVTGAAAGQQFSLEGAEVAVGRHRHNDIVIADPRVSSFHFRIGRRGPSFHLVDLGSRNGTWVNGLRVTDQRLSDRDEIRIGNTSLILIELATEQHLTADSRRRLRQFEGLWNALESAARGSDPGSFELMCRELVDGLLREAIGYRVEQEAPYFRGIAGFVVHCPLMWIRHSRFPILFIAYDTRRPDVLPDVTKQIEIANAGGFFALLVVVPTNPRTGSESSTLGRSLANSVFRHDFVVLDRDHLASIITYGSSQRLVEIILEQGIELSTLSPYVVRGPVPEGMFFGRERELKAISQTIRNHDYALVGGRRIGKSSILLKLGRVLGHDPHTAPAYLNCEDKFSPGALLSGLGNALEPAVDIEEPSQLRAALAERAKAQAPLPVFLLDEVDEVLTEDAATAQAGQLFKTLRSLSHQGLCRFVFSGSRSLHRHLHDARSPFFNFCEEMRLAMLDGKSVAEIVSKPLQQLGFELPDREALIDRMIRATGGHPNLVQWLCDRLVKTVNGRRIDLALLEGIMEESAYQEHFLETSWGDATPLERLVSMVIAGPEVEFEAVFLRMKALGVTDRHRVMDALGTLELFALLERRGSGYRLLLPEFVRIVHLARDMPTQMAQLVAEGGE